jgi:hypothetical protein
VGEEYSDESLSIDWPDCRIDCAVFTVSGFDWWPFAARGAA